jgi:hypothetical protein
MATVDYLTETPNTTTKIEELKVGDILVSTGGWNCTFVQFAVVTATSDSSVWLKQIGRVYVTGDWSEHTAAPSRSDYEQLLADIKEDQKAVKKQSFRKNIYYKDRKKNQVANTGLSDGGLTYYTPWNGEPTHGNCD